MKTHHNNTAMAEATGGQRIAMGRNRPIRLVSCLSLLVTPLLAAPPKVENVRVQHQPGSLDVDILYDLSAEKGSAWRVRLAASTNGGASFVEFTNRIRGVVTPVRSGMAQRLVWSPPASWVGEIARDVRIRIDVTAPWAPPQMVAIRPGEFVMGSPSVEPGRGPNEGPVTRVQLTRGYWLGQHEVTQAEWESVMGTNPAFFAKRPAHPIENVSWEEAMEFCRRVTERESMAGRLPDGYEFRLPTEAEWEYACRAGTTGATAFGDNLVSRQANFDGSRPFVPASQPVQAFRRAETAPVGSYAPNGWGLYDMHGNVWEWCRDWYGPNLPGGSVSDPTGPKSGTKHVMRGGGWIYGGAFCRSASRAMPSPSDRDGDIGFRLACAPIIR